MSSDESGTVNAYLKKFLLLKCDEALGEKVDEAELTRVEDYFEGIKRYENLNPEDIGNAISVHQTGYLELINIVSNEISFDAEKITAARFYSVLNLIKKRKRTQ